MKTIHAKLNRYTREANTFEHYIVLEVEDDVEVDQDLIEDIVLRGPDNPYLPDGVKVRFYDMTQTDGEIYEEEFDEADIEIEDDD